MEVSTCAADTDSETPNMVMRNTWSEPVGLGATTKGWRPISVKIHPKESARNGAGMVHTAALANHCWVGTRPRRVSHRATAPRAVAISPRPIMKRNDQYVTARLGR